MSLSKTMSIVLGAIILILGLIPLLNSLKVIGFSIPALPGIVMWILVIIGGAYIIWDVFLINNNFLQPAHWALVAFGVVLIAFGGIPFANQMHWIGFTLPVMAQLITSIIHTAAGATLLISGFFIMM